MYWKRSVPAVCTAASSNFLPVRAAARTDLCSANSLPVPRRTPRASYLQTYHVLEVMTGAMKSAETGTVYEVKSHFEREAPMDPSLPHGVL